MTKMMFDYETAIEGINKWLIQNNIENIIWIRHDVYQNEYPKGSFPILDNGLIAIPLECTIEPIMCERNSVNIALTTHILFKGLESNYSYMYSIEKFEQCISLYYKYRYGELRKYLLIFDDNMLSITLNSDTYKFEIAMINNHHSVYISVNDLYNILTEHMDSQNSVEYWKEYLKTGMRDTAEIYAHNPEKIPATIDSSDLIGKKFMLPLKYKRYWLQAMHELLYSFIHIEEDEEDVVMLVLIMSLKTTYDEHLGN